MVDQSSDLKTLYITSAEDPKPELNPSNLRLYHHHVCPFSEKVRCALAAKNLPYQGVEIDMGKKPQWFIDICGTVPILELPDGKLFSDSKQIIDYLQETYPDSGYSLLPKEPETIELLRNTVPLAEKLFKSWYPIQARRAYDEAEFKAMISALEEVEEFIAKNENKSSAFALGTENPTILDIHIYAAATRI